MWEIQDITKMSKEEVLTQVYPDEIEYIFRKKRQQVEERYEGYLHQLNAILAGFGAKTEDGCSFYEKYQQQIVEIIKALEGTENKKEDIDTEKNYTKEYVNKQFDKLKSLQEVIASTKTMRG